MRPFEAAATSPGDPWLNIAIFGAFVAITMIIPRKATIAPRPAAREKPTTNASLATWVRESRAG